MAYIYLLASLIFACIWLAFFFLRRDLRSKMLWMSFIGFIFGFSESMFIPKYWVPRFQVIALGFLGKEVFLESFLFNFFFCGLVAVFGQVLLGQKLFRMKVPIWTVFLGPLAFSTYLINLILFNPSKFQIMHYVVFSLLIGALTQLWFMKNDLRKRIFFGALAFSLFYAFVFSAFWFLLVNVRTSYNLAGLNWFRIFGMPFEEFAWAFVFALAWQPVYEIVLRNK